jgi:hypothetical protein
MDDLHNKNASSGRLLARTRDAHISVYCRLFGDVVPICVCTIRKKEMNTFGWTSCNGCAIGLLQYSINGHSEPAS